MLNFIDRRRRFYTQPQNHILTGGNTAEQPTGVIGFRHNFAAAVHVKYVVVFAGEHFRCGKSATEFDAFCRTDGKQTVRQFRIQFFECRIAQSCRQTFDVQFHHAANRIAGFSDVANVGFHLCGNCRIGAAHRIFLDEIVIHGLRLKFADFPHKSVKLDAVFPQHLFDNAAGAAALLEIARAFSELPTAPPRTIIFLFLTGEEKGLLGSRYYLDNPVQPLYKTIANVNIDGLAMFDTFNDIVGIGAELSTLGDDLREAASINGLAVSPLPAEFTWQASFARSDQIAFAQAGIPSLLTLEGLDYRHSDRDSALARVLHWNRTIYHTPFDDLQQSIDEKAMAQHARLIFTLCRLLADRGKSPEWHPGASYLYERLQSIAEKK